jgi:hypothetical protein
VGRTIGRYFFGILTAILDAFFYITAIVPLGFALLAAVCEYMEKKFTLPESE